MQKETADMTLELGKYVAYGEIFATRKNCVHGWIGMMGMDTAVHFELTGNCEPDLAGKHLRFRVHNLPAHAFDERSVPGFQIRHVGPVGKITGALKLRVDSHGNPLPPDVDGRDSTAEWKNLLHMEWFSQNGRVVIEMIDPVMQIVTPETEGDAEADNFFGPLFPEQPELKGDQGPFPDTIEVEAKLDKNDITEDFYCLGDEGEDEEFADFLASADELDAQTRAHMEKFERSLEEDRKARKVMRETELLDDLIESGAAGESILAMLGDDAPLPDPDSLNENQAVTVLRVLLAKLALQGISLHMCEHVTALDAYRIFLEEIVPESTCFGELRGTGWVQHYSTGEHCRECERKFDEEWTEPT
jgi:hypothetical protein